MEVIGSWQARVTRKAVRYQNLRRISAKHSRKILPRGPVSDNVRQSRVVLLDSFTRLEAIPATRATQSTNSQSRVGLDDRPGEQLAVRARGQQYVGSGMIGRISANRERRH